ncbi:uncharacterized protein LOC128566755 [Nycticebus coucang]|uniref:uncharacterized protein LOC128566755 n=1 Tax=Nycticebus coucang TaxID=9470 RepID=UPI00234D35EC|nr:uncharacterized protein LOC128566755 [Nycticebus coucang]
MIRHRCLRKPWGDSGLRRRARAELQQCCARLPAQARSGTPATRQPHCALARSETRRARPAALPAPPCRRNPPSWSHRPRHSSSTPRGGTLVERCRALHEIRTLIGSQDSTEPFPRAATCEALSWVGRRFRTPDSENPALVPHHTHPQVEAYENGNLKKRTAKWTRTELWDYFGGDVCNSPGPFAPGLEPEHIQRHFLGWAWLETV